VGGAAKDDFLLRQVALVIEAIARAMGKASPGDVAASKAELAAAAHLLLGARSGLLDKLDAATAAQLINDPEVIGAYAELARAGSEIARLEGDASTESRLAQRATVLRSQAESRRRS
jgi:hypothetical protein